MTHPDPRTFETQIEIRAPRDAVWRAIREANELQRWFAPLVVADDHVGGEVVWQWEAHHRWPQRIEVIEPGRRLRTRYDSAVDDGHGGKQPLFVAFVLEGDRGTTTLRLVHSGFGAEADFDAEYDGISRGWPVELGSLRLYLEQHAGHDRQLAWSTADVDLDAADAWRRLTGPDGFACGPEVAAMREGEPFRFRTVDGDVFEGTTLRCNPREFTGDATSHGGAFLRITAERWGGMTHVWCWLGAYRRDAQEPAALQARWDAMLTRLFEREGAR